MAANVPLRLGFLYPGYAAEDDYARLTGMLSTDVVADIEHTALGREGDTHTVSRLRELGEPGRLAAGVDRLRNRAVRAVVWACTSGSFVYGLAGAQQQAATLRARSGLPVSSTSLGFVHAARTLGIRTVGVAATYPEDVAASFADFLSVAGIRVLGMSTSRIMSATDASRLGEDALVELVSAVDRPDADAVLVPDTTLRTVECLPRLEEMSGRPVLTANQVSVWEALRLIGMTDVCAAAGRLFTGQVVRSRRARVVHRKERAVTR